MKSSFFLSAIVALGIVGCDDSSVSEVIEGPLLSNGQCESGIGESNVYGLMDFYDNVEFKSGDYVQLTIEDTSEVDSSSIIISTHCIWIEGDETLPMSFNILFRQQDITEGNEYNVRAAYFEYISEEKYERTHLTTESYPVLTNGWTYNVDIILSKT